MASINLYFDEKHVPANGKCALKISISHKSKTRYINLSINLELSEWDSLTFQVINRPDKSMLNRYISQRMKEVNDAIDMLRRSGRLGNMSCTEVRDTILSLYQNPDRTIIKNTFAYCFEQFTKLHTGRTCEIYQATINRLREFAGNRYESLTFEDITGDWLTKFDMFLSKQSPSRNARNIHLRNIRAVFNNAIDNEITSFYPFRKFHIKPQETAKRSLSVEQLRELANAKLPPDIEKYRDAFMLLFMLCGINVVDFCGLKEFVAGRVEYTRKKTKKFYSIKVEPEAMALFEKYRNKVYLFGPVGSVEDYRTFARRLNAALQQIERNGHPMFPTLTTYWARHTWATIASELDIPYDVISHALGHSHSSGARVTEVYINFNRKKIDQANRKVLDYVFYDKM